MKQQILKISMVLGCIVAIAAGCARSDQAPVAKPLPDSVNVHWGLYSGLPNPGWTITNKAVVQELGDTLSSLPNADAANWRDHLGPDCFTLSCPKDTKLPMLIEVSRGLIKIHRDVTNGAAGIVLNDESKRVKAILDRTRPKNIHHPHTVTKVPEIIRGPTKVSLGVRVGRAEE